MKHINIEEITVSLQRLNISISPQRQICVQLLSFSTHLSNGVDGVPALRQDFWVGVIEKADKA